MPEKTQEYTVQLKHTFPNTQRVRAGVVFVKGETKVLQLTKDQVGAFKDDSQYFTIQKGSRKAKNQGSDEATSSPKVDAGATQTAPDATTAPEVTTPETTVDEEETDGEDQTATEPVTTPEDGDEPKTLTDTGEDLDKLLKNYNRDQLDQMATNAQVQDVKAFANKREVAEALIAKREG